MLRMRAVGFGKADEIQAFDNHKHGPIMDFGCLTERAHVMHRGLSNRRAQNAANTIEFRFYWASAGMHRNATHLEMNGEPC